MVTKIFKFEVVLASSHVLSALFSALADCVDASECLLVDGASIKDVAVDHLTKLERQQEEWA